LDPRTPLWQALLGQLISQSIGYFALVGLLYAVFWRWGARWFAARRIQKTPRVDGAQVQREVSNTVVTLVVSTVNITAILLMHRAGWTKLSSDRAAFSAAQIALTFVGLVLFNDAWFYWLHRLMHHKRLFRYVHAVHHKSVDVNPFTSYSFHAVEALLLGAWIVPAVLIVPMYLPALGALQAFGLANNVMSHLGYELLPKWLVRVPGLRWTNTATFHQLHHSQFDKNYALHFRFWDRLMGTESPDYERVFSERE
jgi:sterol desaturase/sphingolipid hydroxylase (fatty acid hydroxylase superfamily)